VGEGGGGGRERGLKEVLRERIKGRRRRGRERGLREGGRGVRVGGKKFL
jgi:hypothetical protein